MKVTITTLFGRVQVELPAGAAVDLMMEAVGLARRWDASPEDGRAGAEGTGADRGKAPLVMTPLAEGAPGELPPEDGNGGVSGDGPDARAGKPVPYDRDPGELRGDAGG